VLKKLGAFFFAFRHLLPVPLVLALVSRARFRGAFWLLGLPLIAAGEAFRVWALMHIGPTTRTREVCADTLVQTGPYAVVRNPLYLGNFLKICGLLCLGGDPLTAALALVFYLIEFASIIAYEESFLHEKFGSEFAAFVERTPMLFPRGGFTEPRLWQPGSFSLKEAFRSEKRTFGSTGTIASFIVMSILYKSKCAGAPKGAAA
jgi:protein-S-isoprenylcysteine O-methyltransferase Ste14